jgi:hypothetical protein
MNFSLITELCESKLIPSKPSLKQWDEADLRELAYMYFLATRILLANADTKQWANAYLERTIHANNFDTWRSDANDFYVLLYALSSDDQFKSAKTISINPVREWMHHTHSEDFAQRTQRLFARLDGMFHVSNSAFKAMRRVVAHWETQDQRERDAVLAKVIAQIKKLAPKSELLVKLKSLLQHQDDAIKESASSGATGAASVATVVGGLGAGFAPDETWRGIYGSTKPVVIRRNPAKKPKRA